MAALCSILPEWRSANWFVVRILLIVSYPLQFCIWYVRERKYQIAQNKRLDRTIKLLRLQEASCSARWQALNLHGRELDLLYKIKLTERLRELRVAQGLHVTFRNSEKAYSQSEKDIFLKWTTGPDARMRYELLAPADHKSVSAAVLIQRHIRLHQRRMRAVKTCQRRIRQLLWIRYELCNPKADMNAQYMHLLEFDSNTFDKKWSRLTNFWNRTWK